MEGYIAEVVTGGVTIAYLVIAADLLRRHQVGLGLAYVAYALANFGLILAMRGY